MVSFKELANELRTYGTIESIRNVDGIYVVHMPDGFNMQIRADSDAIEEYHGRSMIYPKVKLEDKWEVLSLNGISEDGLLYIGKANASNGRGLKKRITEFVKYGYGLCNNHRGGRAVWQLENNKELLLEIIECPNPEEIEHQKLLAYKQIYEDYPFANWRS